MKCKIHFLCVPEMWAMIISKGKISHDCKLPSSAESGLGRLEVGMQAYKRDRKSGRDVGSASSPERPHKYGNQHGHTKASHRPQWLRQPVHPSTVR